MQVERAQKSRLTPLFAPLFTPSQQFDHSKSADNSFVEIDITLENIGLEADINWAYWLCECYIGGDCSDEYIVSH